MDKGDAMEIRKTYKDISPTLLYDEIKEFALGQGVILKQDKFESYSKPSDSSTFTYRGTMAFNLQGKEALSVHIIGEDKGETRLMLDSSDEVFPAVKMKALEDNLNFILGSYESKT
jgi:hypothetical protein